MVQRDKLNLILAQLRQAVANLGTTTNSITSVLSAERGDR
jgi:hypothetical protein